MRTKDRYQAVIEYFQQSMPVAESELNYSSPFELLVAVILSAQCTDKRVNLTTPALFKAFPDAQSMAQASAEEIFPYIRSISYPNNKARNLHGMSRTLVEEFNSEVPSDLTDLLKIPGVGRKTANVIRSVIFGQSAMAVDTHVFRVSERIGLTTKSKNPRQTEETLVRYIPSELIGKAHHWLILHGRYVCKARRPDCLNCGLTEMCRYYQKNNKNES